MSNTGRSNAVADLQRIARTFGRRAAGEKARLLDLLARCDRLTPRELLVLHDTLCFLRAYPDDPQVLRHVVRVGGRLREWIHDVRGGVESTTLADTGFPGAVVAHPSWYAVLTKMLREFPGCFEIDWDAYEDDPALHHALVLLVTNGECQGLDDIGLSWPAWSANAKADPQTSDIEFVLRLFAGSSFATQEQAHLFDACGVPIRYSLKTPGTGRCEIAMPGARVCYQKGPIPHDRSPLGSATPSPPASRALASVATGRNLLRVALAALCARRLEISALSYADPRTAIVVPCGRGLQVGLLGVEPEYRDALDVNHLCLILKNGVPIAYGPTSVYFGCCEMGINLFPEFRGSEIRYVYAQLIRVLHHVLGARYFYLTSYGMGEGNAEAIRSGAFWFYRKLGFAVTNPDVEVLARKEEERMGQDPTHRSSVRTLHALSRTSAYLDLSGGACRPLSLSAIGLRQSRFVAERFSGDRRRAVDRCVAKVARVLGVEDLQQWSRGRRRALEILAPLLCMIPDFEAWSPEDRRRTLQLILKKGGRSEVGADRLLVRHSALATALRELAEE